MPLLLCVDVEPDERCVEEAEGAWAGFERLLERLPELRERLAALTSGAARVNWFVRADPQVEDLHGDPGWALRHYRDAWAQLRDAGDEVGVHAHAWRRRGDGQWLVDHGDERWVEGCFATALAAFEAAFGEPARAVRGGDRFMCESVVELLERLGVVADLTVEPRMPPAAGVGTDPATGSLPDYRRAPEVAYRPRRGDFVGTGGPARSLWMLPLTSGGPEVLYPWMDHFQFSQRLNERLGEGPCSHLAFAIRSDLALDDEPWERTLVNLERAAYIPSAAIGRRVQMTTATEFARSLR